MTNEQEILQKTEGMIDELKTVCADFGLANDSSEYKIITESFLYKFLNDKFLHDLRQCSDLKDVENIETAYINLDDDARELAIMELPSSTAVIRSDYLLSTLFNHQDVEGFAKEFDGALLGIADDNRDIFSVRMGGDDRIRLFEGISESVRDRNKRDGFCKAIINKLANFSFEEAFGQSYDFFSAVFEYLVKDYNKDSGEYGEYFTPHSIASIIARVLVPDSDENVTVYDPAAGSGTLVLAIAHEIGENNCTIYTQDRSQKANEFMRLNLILNGLVHSLPNVINDDTLEHPRHLEADKKRVKRFDYIVSNPPFKCDFSSTRDKLAGENYKSRFWAGVPNVPARDKKKMAIYLMFLQHIIYSMKTKKNGGAKAAIVVPTGFLTAKGKIELAIRKRLVDEKMLRGVISMPSNIFANTGTNVSILFIDSSVDHDDIVLMDGSKLGTRVKIGKNQRTVLSNEEIRMIIDTFNGAEQVDGFSAVVQAEGIQGKGYSFSAGQYFAIRIEYIDLTPDEFNAEIEKQMKTLRELFAEGNKLQNEIEAQMKKVRFE